jgi:hypothetical protein
MSESVAQQNASTVRDFPDRLPPMVVKELRQGLRARLYGETVAGFHLVLLVLLFPILNFGQSSGVEGAQRLLWWIFTGVLVLLLPLRGLSALVQERRENTLDTLLLTNLSAGRIVWGKWLAIASQIAVTGISLIPYTIILYAAGGISLTESLNCLLRLGMLGLTLTAAYVALSWNGSWLWRAGPALILTWLALTQGAGPMIRSLTGGGLVPGEAGLVRLLAETAGTAALIYLLLEGASSRLGPWTEDHRTGPQRLGLALPLLLAAGAGHAAWQEVLGPVALAGLTLISLTALTAPWPPPRAVPRQGWPRWRMAGQGWPQGVAWAMAAWSFLLLVMGRWLPADQRAMTLQLMAWLFTGRLLLFCFPESKRNRAAALLGTGLILLLGQAALLLAADLLDLPALRTAATAIPGGMAGVGGPHPHPAMGWITGSTAALCGVLALVALGRHHPDRQEGGL